MELWYNDYLSSDATSAEAGLLHDYGPYAEHLGRLTGRVLDVGGGAGLAARYLDPSCEYWVIDPSNVWQEPQWSDFARRFRGGGPEPRFVSGTGERLPFQTGEFDHAMAFWSLNHASAPKDCVGEIVRVVKPGGSVLLVLEDMVPDWKDLPAFARSRLAERLGRAEAFPVSWGQAEAPTLMATVLRKLSRRDWPLQGDHTRIAEADVREAAGRSLRLLDRSWAGGFLSMTFERSTIAA